MTSVRCLKDLQRAVALERAALVEHSLYFCVRSTADVRLFMEHHVFAVWDFMSLLKALQAELTCVAVPWVPRGEPLARRLINEIVLGEESDEGIGGGYSSHYELYRSAMLECGADTTRIDAFVEHVAGGQPVRDALAATEVPSACQRFVSATFEVIESHSLPRIAAAFTIGREEIIPDMFTKLIEDIGKRSGGRLGRFLDYLTRHVEIDGERHGPMAAQLLEGLCGQDFGHWGEAEAGAKAALRARLAFWTEIEGELARRDSVAAAPR
jgi:hypothetical protein